MRAIAAALTLASAAEWREQARSQGVTVFSRERPGSHVHELRAVGEIDAPPPVVHRVLTDFARYREILPHFTESRVVWTEGDGKVVHLYCVFDAPVIALRDWTERIVDESDWKDGAGYFKIRWTTSDRGPPPREDRVRIHAEGSWLLEPLDGGARTRATHWLFTDPGGSLPGWLVNAANRRGLPDTFASLRKHAADPRYAR